MGSSYRIKDRQITVVNRRIGKQNMTITVLDNDKNAEGQFLPHSYVVNYWDAATGKLNRVETFQERWRRIGSWDLPAMRSILTTSDAGLSIKLSSSRSTRCSDRNEIGARPSTGHISAWARGPAEGGGYRSHRIAPDQLTGAEQVADVLRRRIALGVISDGRRRIFPGFADPPQVRAGTAPKHVVIGLVLPWLGQISSTFLNISSAFSRLFRSSWARAR